MSSPFVRGPVGLLVVVCGLAAGCPPEVPPPAGPPVWTPEVSYPTPEAATVRGLLDRRGLIHAHSVFSHDACDDMPILDNGERDPVCLDDFRRGFCQAGHDFVFLSDHPTHFADGAFPDTLLYDPARGDTLVDRGAGPVANWVGDCDRPGLIIAGTEGETLTVGLEGHVPGDSAARRALYGSRDPAALGTLHDQGALVLLMHTEDETPETLADPGIDGFEMFNLHANTLLNVGNILEVLLRIGDGDPEVAHPDLLALHLVSEDDRYLSKWSKVLAAGHKKVTTMGTDCHRNALPTITADGERIDSYRRMMRMFSNHLLVEPAADGTYDDTHLKAALAAGRLYGAFEYLGYPVGFDYRAETGGTVHEMGETVALDEGAVFQLTLPTIQNLDPTAPQPVFTTRILRATDEGWAEVARGDGDLSYTPDAPGAYRAEVRMIPYHLHQALRADAKLLLVWRFDDEDAADWVWIYSNAIYVE